jgi:hypothetical protein
MKKLYNLFLGTFLFFMLSSHAQTTSNLIVFSENGEKFTLSVNGVPQNDLPESNVRVEGLTGEFHQVTVVFEDKALGMAKQNFAIEPGKEQKAQVTLKKNGKWAIRPFGPPTALSAGEPAPPAPPTAPRPAPESVAAEPQTTTTQTTVTTTIPDSNDESFDMNVGINGESIGVSVKVNSGMVSQQTTVTETSSSHSESDTWSDSDAVVVDDCAPMTPTDFNSAISSLNSKTFADSRLTQAKQILKSNCMSAEQIKETMGAFEFEDDKLEFAKAAYDKCADPQNYWKVNDAFEFEMTIDELNEYIESK